MAERAALGHRLVLKDRAPRGRVEAAMYDLNWNLVDAAAPHGDVEVELVYTRGDDDLHHVHYFEDAFLQVSYLEIMGPDATRLRAVFAAALDCWTVAEIRADYDRSTGDLASRIHAVFLAGMAAPPYFSADHFAILSDAFADADPIVRSSAVHAALFVPWPELHEPLARIATEDRDQRTRDRARSMLGILAELDV